MTVPARRHATLVGALLLAACGVPAGGPLERVTIPEGASFRQFTDSLVAHGVVTNRTWFRLVVRLRKLDRAVRAGVYDLPRGASAWAVVTVLASGKSVQQRFTVPEGETLLEVADLAQRQLGIPRDSLLAAARDPALLREAGIEAATAEGFLRPETYLFPAGVGARDVVRQMLAQFDAAWDTAWDGRLAALGLTRVQAVTLASIVEGEARADDERETIAGVYLNRLRRGMALQADPTVQYAIEQATGKRKPRLYVKDYQFPSPYNTYLQPGLPPGPVNNPGARSLEAVTQPRDVPYLYFVAGPDGRHTFSATYDEHLRAVARARRLRDAADSAN